ncbi:hypothetical protein AZ66_29235 [Paenibacillus sp. E194]|uniref:hypothetical protein n=1 Tax=Paenibacillus sp. E194 TaxID=1458845 RepID=UPI0005C9EC91|nr:hypothetical protein [Paenibacillus sp. E194]KJB84713.1 hypothetical protein AZ66_29235 [Paenibacillus sp. E194]
MFWRKKKQKESVTNSTDYTGFLFVQALEVSDTYYQALVKNIPDHPLVMDKENHWYFYFAIAASMVGILDQRESYEEKYLSLMRRIGEWHDYGLEVSEDFNNYLKNSRQLSEDINKLNVVIAQWLYFNVKETIEIVDEEIEPFILAGQFIVDNFFAWFSKNEVD